MVKEAQCCSFVLVVAVGMLCNCIGVSDQSMRLLRHHRDQRVPDHQSEPEKSVARAVMAMQSESITDWIQMHPLCQRNVTSYVGQTAHMHCCLARLERDLSVSWIRKKDLVVLAHGHLVFTSDDRVKVFEDNGIWTLELRRVDHSDGGIYECQTNSENKTSVGVSLSIMETRAEIAGPANKFLKMGSTLKLSCHVYLGAQGPDEDYKKNAVIHWFQDARLLDPLLDKWKRKKVRLSTGTDVSDNGLHGWLQLDKMTAYDAGNYSCVPSYAIPDWVQVHILHGENQAELYDGVSEVKLDTLSNDGWSSTCPMMALSGYILAVIFFKMGNHV